MIEQGKKKRFCLAIIKPSHYDDQGYVIQWFRSAIPSNSLAVLYGLALECAERKVLGEDVEIDIHALDETNSHIDPARIARLIKQSEARMVMLVGVQSNQFPRAIDIAAPLRQRRPGLPLEPAWLFYPKYIVETVWKQIRWVSLYARLRLIYKKIRRDPHRFQYLDAALEPVADDEIETREIFQSEAAHIYVIHAQEMERIRRGDIK
jgi:hypothetical protein